MPDDIQSKYDRLYGRARPGTVGLRSFDEGVVKTLRAVQDKTVEGREMFLIKGIPDIETTPGIGGVPIHFFFPEDVLANFRVPSIVVSRDDISPAMNRWHPGSLQYRAPALGANQVSVNGVTGYDTMEEMQQAVPFDIAYSLTLYARTRTQGNILFDYVLRTYPPYCNVKVQDSIGDYRLYSAFTESLGMLDDVPEVGNRVIVFAVTLRVEAELDLNDPFTFKTVQGTKINTKQGI